MPGYLCSVTGGNDVQSGEQAGDKLEVVGWLCEYVSGKDELVTEVLPTVVGVNGDVISSELMSDEMEHCRGNIRRIFPSSLCVPTLEDTGLEEDGTSVVLGVQNATDKLHRSEDSDESGLCKDRCFICSNDGAIVNSSLSLLW